ncbi:MAG: type I restriction-modification system subunit M [Clostridia bacterium]|nr:type I restriction-modification system subunit M [Clostridia bacterium]
MTKRKDIETVLWDACGTFRGKIDSSKYKDYILTMLFVKYISDVIKEKEAELMAKYNNDKKRVERALQRERFFVPKEATFDYLYENRNDDEVGELINKALASIENSNGGKLRDLFNGLNFNDREIGEKKQKNSILKSLLVDFNKIDLRPSKLEKNDIIGEAYMFMIEKFASDAGKKGGEFFTPSEVSELVARLASPKVNDRIYDGTCGSGSLLIKAFQQVPNKKAQIYGQESNAQTWTLAKMNMFLHEIDDAKIYNGDTISEPKTIENDKLMQFQTIVANPPFSLDKWAFGYSSDSSDDKFKMLAELDLYKRFDWGVPPKSKGDYAFILHMLHSLDGNGGRMAVVMPHGVLFRGASEGKIRERLIKLNLLDAVIGLPSNLFYGTSIPACILVFKKGRTKDTVQFIDASGEGHFEKGKNQNKLRETDISEIVKAYKENKEIEKFSHIATLDEIKENDYNLNIPRYVDTFEEEEIIDIEKVNKEIKDIKTELTAVEEKMQKYLIELGLEG